MKIKALSKLYLGLAFLGLASVAGSAQSATLSSPERSGNQFQFNLQGDPFRSYVIQGSSNLQQWISLTTNVSPSAMRPLSFAASNGFSFYRSAPFMRTNLVSKAIQTTGSFDLRGNNFLMDSFDSRDPAFSTNGRYDVAKRSDHGELSLDLGLDDSLVKGRVTIYGSIARGPEAPMMIGSNGTVGSFAWIYGGNNGIQPGKLTTDLNPYFPETKPPFIGGYSSSPPGGVITNIHSDGTNITTNVIYFDRIFNDDGDYKFVVLEGKTLVRAKVRVWVSDNITITGQDSIVIKTNASLELYCNGTDSMIAGQGIINEDDKPTNFIYYGFPGNTNLHLTFSSSFTGIIYAPQARVVIGGGGNDAYDFIGAVVARSVLLNGHFNFHYDDALRELLLNP